MTINASRANFNAADYIDPSVAPAKEAPIMVAGARGMVGSALVRRLSSGGYTRILAPTRGELDLMDQASVHSYLARNKPAFIFIAAAKVGGRVVSRQGYFAMDDFTVLRTNATPEPGSVTLALAAMGGLALTTRRRRSHKA